MKDDFRFDDEKEPLGRGDGQDPPPNGQTPQDPAPPKKDFSGDFVLGEGFRLPDEPDEPDGFSDGEPEGPEDTAPAGQRESAPAAGPPPGARRKKAKKRAQKGCLKSLIWVGVIGLVSVGLAVSIILVFRDVLAIGKSDTPEVVEIEQGMSTTQIAETLEEHGIIDMPVVFRLYTKLMGHDGTFRYGVYYLNPAQGYDAIVERLQTEGQRAEAVTVKIKEGATVDGIAAQLEEAGVCSGRHFKTAMNQEKFDFKFLENVPRDSVYRYLEGYLFPDTYQFYPDDTVTGAKMVITRMLENLNGKLKAGAYAEAARRKLTMHEIMTMASIVELEASGMPEEMPKVAAVFFNRLAWKDQPPMLGSTPTSKYPDKRYDTNVHEKLPPGPLCSPSLNAINAALEPEKGFGYTYFVTDKAMNFYYNKTLAEHEKTVQKLKNEGNWQY